jgi:hypothetical protein
VLKPNGYLVISTPNASSWKQFAMGVLETDRRIQDILKAEDDDKSHVGDQREHIYSWTIYTLVKLLQLAGFEFVAYSYGGVSIILKVRSNKQPPKVKAVA